MATIDMSKVTDRDQRKAYQRMSNAGKGDRCRSNSLDFKLNYERIRWTKQKAK